MEKNEILELHQKQGDILLRFLVPREDEKTIYAFSDQVKLRKKIKEEKVGQMGAYLNNNKRCRSLQLLAYFGETFEETCGLCDVCLKELDFDPGDRLRLKAEILKTLSRGPKTSRELMAAWEYPEFETLNCLQNLLHEGKLRLGSKNQYILL
jgi:ATP-dependent DNA helicase RecQ